MNLRERVLRGGLYLVGRHMAGMLLSIAGAIAITRLIGPANFGIYSGALSIVMFLVDIGTIGSDVFLVRRQKDPDVALYDQVFTLTLASGVVLTAMMYLALPFLHNILNHHFFAPLIALVPSIPVSLLVTAPQAKIERELNYKAIGLLDLAGQVSYYVVAVFLAWRGLGFWAQVTGYWAWQIVFVLGMCIAAHYRPRFCWHTILLREILAYGVPYSSNQWILQARTLIAPIVVGHFLGPAAVGYVALATQAAETLSFVKNITGRVSIAAFAKIQGNVVALREAHAEAMLLQVMALGPFLDLFALVASPAITIILGSNWRGVLMIYPYIAVTYLAAVVFSMHTSVLAVVGRNGIVATAYGAQVAIALATSALLVPHLGIVGFGIAQMIGIGGLLLLHLATRRIMSISYASITPWIIGFVPPLFATIAPPWLSAVLLVPVVSVALVPRYRRPALTYGRELLVSVLPARFQRKAVSL